jgi:hypothetical protein
LLVAVPLAAAIAILFRFWLKRYWESALYLGKPSEACRGEVLKEVPQRASESPALGTP